MKILHITASYKPAYIYGGPVRSVGKLCEALTHLKFQSESRLEKFSNNALLNVQVFTTTANGTVELELAAGSAKLVDNVPVIYFNRWTKDHSHFSPSLLWNLRKEIRHYNRPVSKGGQKMLVHIHAWWNLVSVLSCLVAKWYKVPIILSPRGMLTPYTQSNRSSFSKKMIHLLIGKGLLQYVHIHATSEQEKKNILEIIQAKSIRVIPNLVEVGSPVSNLKDELLSKKNPGAVFKLIFLSRIEEKKGLELLFEALSIINFPWALTIAGTGEKRYIQSLKSMAESLKLSDRIDWVGLVGNYKKFSVMASHDMLVLTSLNENFANVVIESLSVGTAVLVSEQVGLADYVKNNELGWVCKLNAEHIKAQILNAYHDRINREKIRDNAPLVIERDFDDEALALRYVEFYENVLRQPLNSKC